jgi:hypothetical protein
MFSRFSSFLLIAIFVIVGTNCPKARIKSIDKTFALVVPETSKSTTASKKNPNINLKIAHYHICPRSMNKWLSVNLSIPLICKTTRACRGNSICPVSASVCCQQSNGCNLCVRKY